METPNKQKPIGPVGPIDPTGALAVEAGAHMVEQQALNVEMEALKVQEEAIRYEQRFIQDPQPIDISLLLLEIKNQIEEFNRYALRFSSEIKQDINMIVSELQDIKEQEDQTAEE